MTKTVVLLNPYGTDVTDFVNGTALVPQLLKGTVMSPGDSLYTLPYDWNASSLTNIETGASLLDAYLQTLSGEILVFAYSEGGQVADYWLTNYGPTSTISPSDLSFLLIGNADRKYGGFVYNHAAFNTVGYTGGKPADTPYSVVDFTRQYDPIADFPNATPIVDALNALETLTVGGTSAWSQAMSAVADVVESTEYSTAALNAVAGLALIHIDYLSVTPADAGNVSLVEGNITWVWSPTYPIPLLGLSTSSPQSDEQTRPVIEEAYERPVTIPPPDYSALIAALAPAWAIQVPSAPVQQPPGNAYQVSPPSTQQVQSLQSQLQQAIWQGFLQIVDGFLDLGTTPSDQLATWNTDIQNALTNLQTATTNIIDSFAPGGTSSEFLTGVTNLLAFFGLTPSDIGGATVINTVWTDVVTGIINPLNAIETQAANIIGMIEQEAVSGVTTLWDWLSGESATVASNASIGATQGTANTNALQAIAANPPPFVGLVPGTQSNITLPGPAMSALSLFATTQSAIGFTRIQLPMTIGAIAFVAARPSSGSLTDFYVNFYTLDPITGALDYLFSSANIESSIPAYGSEDWVEYEFPGPDQIAAVSGQVIAVEFQVVSTTDYAYVYGQNTGVPNRASALMQNVGGYRSSPGTSVPTGNIASSGFAFSPGAPYVALEPTDLPADYEPPVQSQYFTAGSGSYTLPGWFNLGTDFLDVIVVGDGGGGGGGLAGAGSAGAGTTVTVTTASGSQTLTGTGGAGGATGTVGLGSTAYQGDGPGNQTLNGLNAYGGTTVNWGQAGSSPGGGGGGAQYFDFYGYAGSPGSYSTATYQPTSATVSIDVGAGGAPNSGFSPGAGAPGGVWLQVRQA